MRLTNYHKDAFVEAVMQDVPTVDLDAKVHPAVKALIDPYLPAAIAKMANNPELRVYLDDTYFSNLGLGVSSMRYPVPRNADGGTGRGFDFLTAPDREKLDAVIGEADEVSGERQALRAKVAGTIAACNTLKQALELLPEFAKYLPAEGEKSTMLPAVANLSAELTKAGFPKGKAKAK